MKILSILPLLIAPLALLLEGCQSTAPEVQPLETPIHVLLLGDSISIGYTQRVGEALGQDARVVRPTRENGRAENCAGTTKGVESITRWLELDGGDWDVIHFNFGLHDLKRVDAQTRKNSNDPGDPRQAEPVQYEQQLRAITEEIVASGARVIFATTTPVPSGGVKPHRDPADVRNYNAIARGVMAEHDIAIDDLYGFMEPRLDELQRPVDVHFTKEGSVALGDEVARSIRRAAGLPVASTQAGDEAIKSAQLDAAKGADFEALRAAFTSANPGYELDWHPSCRELSASSTSRVLFVQGPAEREAAPTVGDILLLDAGASWELASGQGVDLLAFSVPGELPAELPRNIRPDWDPSITDTPGGCAEEASAYRRILLTWLEEKGPYVLHSLNAHRVCINDSFSHYHPRESGFDEFYLVQLAPAGARVLTSESVADIENQAVTRADAASLIRSRPLRTGQLIYMPRGTMHRGLGGAVVQVISVPGFVPNSEVGLDHHLLAINDSLGLEGAAALPFHAAAASEAVIK